MSSIVFKVGSPGKKVSAKCDVLDRAKDNPNNKAVKADVGSQIEKELEELKKLTEEVERKVGV